MVTALLILLPVMCIITGVFTAWGLYTGLKWQIQVNQGKEPEKPIEKGISNPFEVIKQNKEEQVAANVLDEWLNGAKEGVK